MMERLETVMHSEFGRREYWLVRDFQALTLYPLAQRAYNLVYVNIVTVTTCVVRPAHTYTGP